MSLNVISPQNPLVSYDLEHWEEEEEEKEDATHRGMEIPPSKACIPGDTGYIPEDTGLYT